MNSRSFIAVTLVILAVATLMRGVWLTADPPVRRSVGIVWHDEGAWVHNARNQALFGVWRTDDWNPVFVAPVFTALEYASFAALGVGTWQARVVPAVSGVAAVVALMIGLLVLAGPRAAVIGGGLLATNYAFVMWNRAALMESTMTMWIVAAWMAWAVASSNRGAAWTRTTAALVAGLFAAAAWFTKAAAAFFVGALALEIVWMAVLAWRNTSPDGRLRLRQSALGATGLVLAFGVIALSFVVPHWNDYQFYNWQMSVTRKPDYTVRALLDRASWLPVVQGIFTGMWIEFVAGMAAMLALVVRFTNIRPGERLLVLWVVVGLAELIVHDSGNERRYVMFIPALIALASLALASPSSVFPRAFQPTRPMRAASALLLIPAFYLIAATMFRPFVINDVEAGRLFVLVRSGGIAAFVLAAIVAWRWRAVWSALGRERTGRAAALLVAIAVLWQVAQFADWARHRTTHNHDASVTLGRLVPAGSLVQGKLANGLALENHIRPLFVGNGFGNYADRLHRDDARYILTYDLPRIGYESSDGSGLIQGMLDHYPRRQTVAAFEVDETRGPDRAVLIDKFPHDSPVHARD